jgi:hypothetical protein
VKKIENISEEDRMSVGSETEQELQNLKSKIENENDLDNIE